MIIRVLFLMFLLLPLHAVAGEELVTVIEAGAEKEAEILLGEHKFASHVTATGNKQYEKYSPVKIWREDGLYHVKGEHYNMYHSPKLARAGYLLIDGIITHIKLSAFTFKGTFKKFWQTSYRGIITFPCTIEGTFEFKNQGYSSWWIEHEDDPRILCDGIADGIKKKEPYELISIRLLDENIKKHREYLMRADRNHRDY